jgi:hypothetical protein
MLCLLVAPRCLAWLQHFNLRRKKKSIVVGKKDDAQTELRVTVTLDRVKRHV